jgi:glycosyltransferase involved in cell wall biosynthesis
MNVLFLTLVKFENLQDQGIYTDLIREFNKNGHNMYIIQPLEKRYKLNTHHNKTDGINILNVKIGNITKTNIIEKGISTITLQKKLKKALKKHYKDISFDLILYATPPITFGSVIEYVKKKFNSVSYLMLKDIFPQNALDIQLLSKRNPIYWYFRYKEKKLYQLSDYIGCMSNANVDYLIENNQQINESKIEVCPNSITPIDFNVDESNKLNIRNEYNLPLDKTIFIYGGNIGKPQGIDFLIKCLDKNEYNSKSFILIVGSGTEYSKLKKYFDNTKPVNSKLIAHVEKEKYELLVKACDVGLIFLDRRFTIPNFPSRLLSYMQASIPVLAATDINSDIGKVIVDNNFGFWCESNDVESFNNFLEILCDKKTRSQMGTNGYNYLLNNYTSKHTYEIILNHFNNQEDRHV